MNIILASKSPRRIELLKKIVDDFEVVPSLVDEALDLNNGIEEGMKKLAYAKANDVYTKHLDSIAIGSDTLVFLGNTPLGKPKDREDASNILKSLRGKKHFVYTSVAILSSTVELVFVEKTKVVFKDFSDTDLNDFLDTDIWVDKSGAYGIQSLDERYIQSIDGDIETVIGFPTASTKEALNFVLDFNRKRGVLND